MFTRQVTPVNGGLVTLQAPLEASDTKDFR
jgi:hypothetical protein